MQAATLRHRAPVNHQPAQRVVPLETVESQDCVATPSVERVQCGKCSKAYSGGSVVTHPPQWSEQLKHHTVLRCLYCDHCGHLQNWLEAAYITGFETNGMARFTLGRVALGEANYLKGKHTIAMFLEENPQAAGVIDNG